MNEKSSHRINGWLGVCVCPLETVQGEYALLLCPCHVNFMKDQYYQCAIFLEGEKHLSSLYTKLLIFCHRFNFFHDFFCKKISSNQTRSNTVKSVLLCLVSD